MSCPGLHRHLQHRSDRLNLQEELHFEATTSAALSFVTTYTLHDFVVVMSDLLQAEYWDSGRASKMDFDMVRLGELSVSMCMV
jgi:hypothetical protein